MVFACGEILYPRSCPTIFICFISAKTQNIHIGRLLNSFRPRVKELLTKRGNFLVILPRDKTGDLQVNNRDLHHPMKTSYHGK